MSHVVILGAGASRAAFPTGDPNGNRLPVMADMVEVLHLGPLLSQYGPITVDNFELFFAELAAKDPECLLLREIEGRVREYFSSLRLPNTATIYDRLVLALQPRDIIATFNWDPLIHLAYQRHIFLQRLPKIVSLHGSVAVGACVKHRSYGSIRARCAICRTPYDPVKLMYPVHQKHYASDSFITGQWDLLRRHVRQGYWLTIFGYGAPDTDVEAVKLLLGMAHDNQLRTDGEVEVIDIKPREELVEKWDPFLGDHYAIHESYDRSVLTRHPRLSSETLWLESKELSPQKERRFPIGDSLAALQAAAAELMREEFARENAAG